MRDLDTLGFTGRARSVDSVSKRFSADSDIRIRGLFAGDKTPIAIQTDYARLGQTGHLLGLSQQQRHSGFTKDERQAFRRISWIKRQIGGACFPNPQQADHHFK